MFAIGGFRKAYKTIVSSKRHDKNNNIDSHGKSNHQSRKGSNHRNEERSIVKDNLSFREPTTTPTTPQVSSTKIHESPLKRSTSLDESFSLSRNKTANPPNPNHTSETLTANQFQVRNRDVSSSSSSSSVACDSLPRSFSQKEALSTSSHSSFMGKSTSSRKYSSLRGSLLSDLHSIDEGDHINPVNYMGKGISRSMTSRQGSVPIRFSSSNGLLKPLAMEKPLECTLEELCFGCVKNISVSRDAINDIGFLTREEEQLTIKVQPGWKKGTKLTFPGTGNEKLGTCPADIILVVTEKKHAMYVRRDGHDLLMEFKIPLVDALTGCMNINVPLLGGEETKLKLDDDEMIIEPGFEKVIVGQGMPKSKERGSRGNLVLQFIVDFPKELTNKQRREVCSILENV